MGFLRKIHLFCILTYTVDSYNIVHRATVNNKQTKKDRQFVLLIRQIAGLNRKTNYKRRWRKMILCHRIIMPIPLEGG